MDEKFVITIGRQLGSGGRAIGEELARRLGVGYYDKELIRLASEQSGLSRRFFEKADERASRRGLSSGLFGLRLSFSAEILMPTHNVLSNDALFKVQSDVIRRLSDEGSCVFVGRCADYILREHPHCVSLFITANHEDRVSRLMRINQVTSVEAEAMMEKIDRRRMGYYNYYSNKRWGDASTYDLCVNSSVLGMDRTIDFIEQFVRQKLQQ